jgi:hypothetical protein
LIICEFCPILGEVANNTSEKYLDETSFGFYTSITIKRNNAILSRWQPHIVVRKHKGRLNATSKATVLGCCKFLFAVRAVPLVTWTWFAPDPVVATVNVENHKGDVVELYVWKSDAPTLSKVSSTKGKRGRRMRR